MILIHQLCVYIYIYLFSMYSSRFSTFFYLNNNKFFYYQQYRSNFKHENIKKNWKSKFCLPSFEFEIFKDTFSPPPDILFLFHNLEVQGARSFPLFSHFYHWSIQHRIEKLPKKIKNSRCSETVGVYNVLATGDASSCFFFTVIFYSRSRTRV